MKAHAEIERVWPRDGHIRLEGRVHGDVPPVPARWELLLVLRGREDVELRYATETDDVTRHFDVTVPVADLVPAGLSGPEKWDLHLTMATGGTETRLRAGRHLDDIPNKKAVMVFPAQYETLDGVRARLRPFYTVYNNLSIACAPEPLRQAVR